jgi:hypothetical protein
MAIDESAVAPLPPAIESTKKREPPSFDQRWAAWQAKGAAHDRAVRRKMALGAPILIVAAIVIYALLGR